METPRGQELVRDPGIRAKPPSSLPLLALPLSSGSFPGLHLFSPFPGSCRVFMLTQRGREDSTSLLLSQPRLGTVAGSRRAEAKSW